MNSETNKHFTYGLDVSKLHLAITGMSLRAGFRTISPGEKQRHGEMLKV